MKKSLPLLAFFNLLAAVCFAQNRDYVRPAAIGISFVLEDYITPERIRSSSLTSVMNNKQWAKIKELAPGVAVTYFKGLTNHTDFAGTLVGSFVNIPIDNKADSGNDEFLLEGDASVNLKMTTEQYWVQPYLSAGVGFSKYKSTFGAILPVGMGLKINLFDEAAVFITSQYRIPVTKETNNYHFVHGIGVSGTIGKKKEPELKAVVIPQAVRDSDNDGVTDDRDKCPDIPGTAEFEGCPIPDTDKDGINDKEDKCPQVAGVVRYQGCPVPDSDKDGINDEEDKCKDESGVARYQGCPVPDTDKDGTNDEEDKCPNLPGSAENQGCPVITDVIRKKVDLAASNIFFATAGYKLLSKSNKSLAEVVKVLNENPDLKLSIHGHTDNTGSAEKNQVLSENRANSVKQYLISKGIDEGRLISTGHGQDEPVADNKTPAGRAKNRRVELKLEY